MFNKYLQDFKEPRIKIYISVCIIFGILLGYGLNNLATSPRINSLTVQLNQTQTQFEDVQTQLNQLVIANEKLQSDITELQQEFDNLNSNSVPIEEYNSLQDDYDEEQNKRIEAESQLNSLEELVDQLSEAYIEIQNEYVDLREKYNKIVILKYVRMIVNGLDINLTTDKTKYGELENITGMLDIHYLNGDPFQGNITFRVKNDFYETATSGFVHKINGTVNYSIKNGFRFGQGKYSLGLSKIIDSDGKTIATLNELIDYTVTLEYG